MATTNSQTQIRLIKDGQDVSFNEIADNIIDTVTNITLSGVDTPLHQAVLPLAASLLFRYMEHVHGETDIPAGVAREMITQLAVALCFADYIVQNDIEVDADSPPISPNDAAEAVVELLAALETEIADMRELTLSRICEAFELDSGTVTKLKYSEIPDVVRRKVEEQRQADN